MADRTRTRIRRPPASSCPSSTLSLQIPSRVTGGRLKGQQRMNRGPVQTCDGGAGVAIMFKSLGNPICLNHQEDDVSLSNEKNTSIFPKHTGSPAGSCNATSSEYAGSAAGHSKSPAVGRRNLSPKEKENKTNEVRLQTMELTLQHMQVSLIEVSSKNDLVLMNVGRILRALNGSERRITSAPHKMPSLPIGNRKDMNTFESFLATDTILAACCDYMSNYIRTAVVDPERKSTKNILTKLLTNSLAKEINQDGGNQKIAFRSLNMYKILQGTLQAAFPQGDLAVGDDALQKWLKDAKWRKQSPHQ